MDIDENNYDSAVRAGVAAAATALSTPQANVQGHQKSDFVRVNDGVSVSDSVKHHPKRTKTQQQNSSSQGSQSSRALMPPPPPRDNAKPPPPGVNANHTNIMPPVHVQFQMGTGFAPPATYKADVAKPTPGVPPAAGLPNKKMPPSYKQNQPAALSTARSPPPADRVFMHSVDSPFQELINIDDDDDDEDYDDDAQTIFEELTATSESYARQEQQKQVQQQSNIRVVDATPKKLPPQRLTDMGPHLQSNRSVRSVRSVRTNGGSVHTNSGSVRNGTGPSTRSQTRSKAPGSTRSGASQTTCTL